jgi:hypothetical protein
MLIIKGIILEKPTDGLSALTSNNVIFGPIDTN